MNNISICKMCIWFDNEACRNNQKICVDNSEYLDTADVIHNICAEEDGDTNET